MDYTKILPYINSLNKNNDSESLYDTIGNFMKESFIPAVSLETAMFLRWIAGFHQPESVLEIGFGSGTSSVFINCLLKNCSRFISLERDTYRYERGKKLLENLQITNIDLIHRDAFHFFKESAQSYDLIFLDAVKREYEMYLDPLKKILSDRGVLICDNIFFGGKVVQDILDKKYVNGVNLLKKFNNLISEDDDLNTVIIPIGDGLSLSYKK